MDLYNPLAVRDGTKGTEAIVNLATAVPKSSRAMVPGAWRETAFVRRTVSANLAQAVTWHGIAGYVQEAFAPIYADGGEEWLTEESPIEPARYNGAVVDAERAALGTGGVVLRFGFFYGPDSDFTRDMVGMVRRGLAPSFGDPDGYVSSVSHDDAATAVVAALALPPGIYNVVDDEPVTKREFARSLAGALGVAPPRHLPKWVAKLGGSLGETLARSQRISNAKLRAASSWRPRLPSVREGWNEVTTAGLQGESAEVV